MKEISFFFLMSLLILSCGVETDNSQNDSSTVSEVATTVSTVNKEPMKPVEEKKTIAKSPYPIEHVMGKFDPKTHTDYTRIDKKYASDGNMFMHKEAYDSFKKMYAAAKKDGISLVIKSATRPFKHQKRIWEEKWTGVRKVDGGNLSKTVPNPEKRAYKILEWSSMPGTSRHHWGTDIDLNAFVNSYFEKGKGLKEYNWLTANAADYGFCQPYSPKGKDRPHGYNEEKWHWSYLPVALKLTNQAKAELKDEMITGFKGSETAPQIKVVEKYVLGINHQCL